MKENSSEYVIAMVVFNILSSFNFVMELVLIGGLISGFIQQTEDLGFKHQACITKDVLEECTQLLDYFRRLNKGFGPLLFMIFSTNIVLLTCVFYYVVLVIEKKGAVIFIFVNALNFVVPSLLLIYTALLAEDGFTALKDMLKVLRL